MSCIAASFAKDEMMRNQLKDHIKAEQEALVDLYKSALGMG